MACITLSFEAESLCRGSNHYLELYVVYVLNLPTFNLVYYFCA